MAGPPGRPRSLASKVFRSASLPATSRMAPPSHCSCCQCFSSWSSECCALFGNGRSDVQRIIALTARRTSFYFAIAFFVFVCAFPFYWMLITSFKANSDLYNVTNIPFWFTEAPTLEHFRYLFEQTLFGRWLLNSFTIGVCVVAITVVTA